MMAERAAQDLGGERGAAHPQQHDIAKALVAHLPGEPLHVVEDLEHPLGDRQPAQAIGDLGCARRSP